MTRIGGSVAAVVLLAACAIDRATAPPARFAPPNRASAEDVLRELSQIVVVARGSGAGADSASRTSVLCGMVGHGPRRVVTRPLFVVDGRVTRLTRDDPRLRPGFSGIVAVFTRAEAGDRFGPGDYDGVVIIRTVRPRGGCWADSLEIRVPHRPTPMLMLDSVR
ncbi:MAG TPA: hypothetical protein VEX86_22975 [Longimicrobium sp.]|nr:hypothetical protein [Longimicrobium sp.]